MAQKVTTEISFIDGRLAPPGTLVDLPEGVEPGTNVASPDRALVNVAVPIAPISPTGPAPTMPQQVPPGVIQTAGGYAAPGGALFVAEGSEAARLAAENGDQIDGDDMPRRIRQPSEMTGDANQAGGIVRPADVRQDGDGNTLPLNDAERAELTELRRLRDNAGIGSDVSSGEQRTDDNGFNADGVIEGTVPEVAKKLDGLTREQLLAVKDAEDDREQPRSGVKHAIDAKLAELAPADDDDDI